MFFENVKYSEIALTITNVKEILEIDDDYPAVENILCSVSDEELFLDKMLSSIDNDSIRCGEIFSKFSPDLKDCLDAFCNCTHLVIWMRDNVESAQEFKVFVDLANISAGESDHDVDKVLCFQSAVMAYSSFFFELRESPAFNNFLLACENLDSNLKRDNFLKEKLIDANRNVRWIEEIKDRHGSVEASSLNMVQLINQSGIYTVGLSSLKPAVSYIKLRYNTILNIETQSTEVYHREMGLEELLELESKLMLITVAKDKRKLVDRLTETLHHIVRISNYLRCLIEDGCHLFSQWNLTGYMNCDKKVSIHIEFNNKSDQISGTNPLDIELTNVIQFLSKCQESWNKHMHAFRNEFPTLNYFTTNQLLQLSLLLAKFRDQSTTKLNREATMLIQHVVPHANIDEAIIVLKEILLSDNKEMQEAMIDNRLSASECTTKSEIETSTEHSMQLMIDKIASDYTLEADFIKLAIKKTGEASDVEFIVHWCLENMKTDDDDDDDDDYSSSQCSLVDKLEEKEMSTIEDDLALNLEDFSQDIASSFDLNLDLVLTAIKKTGEINDRDKIVEWCLENLNHDVASYSENEAQLDKGSRQNGIVLTNEISLDFSPTVLTKQLDTLLTSLDETWTTFLSSVDDMEAQDYISFKTLALLLKELNVKFNENINRIFPTYFKEGVPNLVVCGSKELHAMVLSLYQLDNVKPLPSLDEILICNSKTSREEIELHCLRAFHDTKGKIFSVLHADSINFDTSCFVERLCLTKSTNYNFRLVFFSNKENDEHSFISTAFDQFRATLPKLVKDKLSSYLMEHLECSTEGSNDFPNLYNLTVIASIRPGCGKSLQISRINEKLDGVLKSTALHQESIDQERILKSWNSSPNETTIYHLDITEVVSNSCDDFLFHLAITRSLTDTLGSLWKCSPTHVYLMEITMDNRKDDEEFEESKFSFKDLLPTIWCTSPKESRDIYAHTLETETYVETELGCTQCMDQDIFESEDVQRPFQYLIYYQAQKSLDNFNYIGPEKSKFECLKILLNYCCIEDPTWGELLNFCRFLNVQLKSCEKSVFCNSAIVGEDLPKFKNFVVKFLIRMSKDFATRSVTISDQSVLVPEVSDRNRWENNPHPYIFFNEDGHTLSLFGFRIRNYCLIDEKNGQTIEQNFISRELHDGLINQGVVFNKAISTMSQQALRQYYIEQLSMIFGVSGYNPDLETNFYELTSDNVLKMLAIHMRFRANIPVIIMGETGTGKTRLIRFICDLQRQNKCKKNMIILKCHGGVTDLHVYSIVRKAISLAEENTNQGVLQTILFFDEANTTNAIGAIKEVMTDGLVDGDPIPKNIGLKFIAAVNPYRAHSIEMIEKLENAGLGYHMKAEDSFDKVGKIPMRRLVYRVKEMSPSLFPLIWDFGILDESTEKKYVTQMVQHYISKFEWPSNLEQLLVNVLSSCQEFMRQQKDECSFVSLRDVERTLSVLVWFVEKLNVILPRFLKKFQSRLSETSCDFNYCIVWAIGVSYYVRLENRTEFLEIISNCFQNFEFFTESRNLSDIIEICQDLFIDELRLERDISKNEALKENVWMMAICIELRMPLFLVGKPGSSKSLAKTVVMDAMQGENSYSPLFKTMKEVQLISFQCSPLATAEGIRSTFVQCQKYQEKQKQHLDRFASVVILDEVGLAEDSPKMPLKTLHPLLEDGCIDDDEEPEAYKKVAFIGISNWALDPAKMNRGVFVSRGTPSSADLKKTAQGIYANDKRVHSLETHIDELVQGYCHVYKIQPREYYGLRDFYSLIKMLFKVCQKQHTITSSDIIDSVGRCFGGCFESFVPTSEFLTQLKTVYSETAVSTDSNKAKNIIFNCLNDEEESRYLLFLTKNSAALKILQDNPTLLKSDNVSILFGSSFPQDQQYTHLCQNINRIKISMELGRTVILCNLTNLYESLYDALNQSYVYLGGSRYVDLGLGTHRVKCRVHPNFRLIVVAEDTEVYEKFPIPLINRLEKHFLGMQTLLTLDQANFVDTIKEWVQKFAHNQASNYHPEDVFIGYHEDAPSSIIFRILAESSSHQTDPDDILTQTKNVLIQCATPDSISRLSNSNLEQNECQSIFERYHTIQHHDCLYDFIVHSHCEESLLVQITTHCRLMTGLARDQLARQLNLTPNKIYLLSLHQIDTEEQFRRKLDSFLSKCDNDRMKNVMVIQCDLGVNNENGNLIDCARYCIQDKIKEYHMARYTIVLLIHLPRVTGGSFVGFPGVPWVCTHIDEISKTSHHLDIPSIKHKSISEVISDNDDTFSELLLECLPRAISQMAFKRDEKNLKSIETITAILKCTNDLSRKFVSVLKKQIVSILSNDEKNGLYPTDWIVSLASKSIDLKEGCTFQQTVWLRLVKIVVPYLKNILLLFDLDCGLEKLASLYNASWEDYDLANFFINTFCHISLTGTLFNFTEIVKCKTFLPDTFKSEIPFSWIYMMIFDEVLGKLGPSANSETIESTLGESSLYCVLRELCNSNEKHIFTFLEDIISIKMSSQSDCKKFATLVSRNICSNVNTFLDNEIETEDIEQTKKGNGNNPTSVGNVYCCFFRLQSRILFFRDLVDLDRRILLDKSFKSKSEISTFTLDVCGISAILKLIEPDPKDLIQYSEQLKWINKVDLIIHHLTSYFNYVDSEKSNLVDLMNCVKEKRVDLMRLDVLRIFFKFVLPQHLSEGIRECVLKSLKLLYSSLKDCNLKVNTNFKKIVNVLTKMSTDSSRLHFSKGVECCFICKESMLDPVALDCGHVACYECINEVRQERIAKSEKNNWICPAKKCRKTYQEDYKLQKTSECDEAVKKHHEFRNLLNIFFIEILQRYVFSCDSAPQQEILESLLRFIVTKKLRNRHVKGSQLASKEMSPFNGDYVDESPVVRSFILQLILRCDWEHAETFLDSFIEEQRKIKEIEDQLNDLCLLIIYAIEDCLLIEKLGRPDRTNNSLKGILSRIQRNAETNFTEITLIQKLRFVAETRADVSFLVDILHGYVSNGPIDEDIENLISQLPKSLMLLNKEDHLQDFLVRILSEKYGINSISQWKCSNMFCELLPKSLHIVQLKYETDIFLLYGDNYLAIRKALKKSLYDKSLDPIKPFFSENDPNNCLFWSLSLFYTLMIEADSVSQLNLSETLNIFSGYNEEFSAIASTFLPTSSPIYSLLTPFSDSKINNHEKSLFTFLFHLKQAMQYESNPQKQTLLMQMSNQINRQDAYLPTMPQDDETEILESATGVPQNVTNYYRCPKGHMYGVGDCGQRNETTKCPECGEVIGAAQTGVPPAAIVLQDNTQPGHILGPVQNNDLPSIQMRGLSALHVALLRFVLHGMMFLTTITNGLESVATIIKCTTDDVQEFLLSHMRLNLLQITRALGQNEDSVIVLLHSIIMKMNNSTSQLQGNLTSKLERRNWETSFSYFVLSPCLKELCEKFHQYQIVLKDDSVEGERVLFEILNKENIVSEFSESDIPFVSSFWHCRRRITIDNLEQWIETAEDTKGRQLADICPSLFHLMTNSEILSYTTKIIPLFRLQTTLIRLCSGRLNLQFVEKMSIREFLFSQIDDSRQRQILLDQITDYLRTLSQLYRYVFMWDRFGRAAEHYIDVEGKIDLSNLPKDITEWPAALLFPFNKGYGLCAKVLLSVLIGGHNKALAAGRAALTTEMETSEDVQWSDLDHVVTVNQISEFSIVAFLPDQLHLLLISNSHHSLHVGQQAAPQLHIDLASLERQVADRFFHGRPRISEIDGLPQFHFASSTTLWTPSSQPLIDIIPQQKLPASLRHQVDSELTSLPELCHFLSLLLTTRDLLRIISGRPDALVAKRMRRLGLLSNATSLTSSENNVYQDHINRMRFLNSHPQPCLKHMDHLIEVVQLLRSRRMLALRQNPWYEILSEKLQTPLPQLATKALVNLIHQISGPEIMERLHFFILSALVRSPSSPAIDDADRDAELMNPEWQLGETLTPYLEDNGVANAALYEEHIPKEILVKHATACFEAVHSIVEEH